MRTLKISSKFAWLLAVSLALLVSVPLAHAVVDHNSSRSNVSQAACCIIIIDGDEDGEWFLDNQDKRKVFRFKGGRLSGTALLKGKLPKSRKGVNLPPGIAVELRRVDGLKQTTKPEADGRFSFRNVKPGNYQIHVVDIKRVGR